MPRQQHDEKFSKRHAMDKPMLGFGTPKSLEGSPLTAHFVAASGEFVGTFMFLLFAFLGHIMAVDQAPNIGSNGSISNQTVIYIALAYGMSLLVTVWTMYRISGGLFNPAVTLGLVITGNLPPVRGAILFPVQILSGICAAAVASAIIPGDIKTVQTAISPGVSVAQGVFLEMFLTAELVFTVLMLAAEKSKDTFIAPIGIGLSLFVAEIAGVYYTGASLNPARSFGPCVVGRNFQHYHWIYWVGPFLGAIISGGYYHFVKFFNYEEANPGQDSSGGQFDREVEEMNSRPSSPRDEEERGLETIDSRVDNGERREGTNGYHPGYAPGRA
ncbi:hypothetical protein LTR86_004606 [Recurvomyces mirabilis]|nr:hypothetical protein LTR86_004606 [Recurvomyces mirabilis]